VNQILQKYTKRLRESPTGKRLIRGASWSLIGALISRGLGIASSLIVARLLGKHGFGALGVIQSTVGMFQVFAGFALGLTATKYVSELKVSDPAKAGRILFLSLTTAVLIAGLISLMLATLAPWLAKNSLAAPQLAKTLRASSLMLFFGAVSGAQTGALVGFEKFKSMARINLTAGVAAFPLMIVATYWAGLEGAVLGLISSLILNCLLNQLALNSACREYGVPRVVKGIWHESRVLWKFSLPAVLSGAMVGPALWLCSAMLVNQPGGYGEMGIYNAANQWRAAILFVPTVVETIILPICSSLRGEGNWGGYKKILLYNVYFNAIMTLGAAVVISLFGHLILRGYGRGFESGYTVLIVLCFSTALAATIGVSGQFIASEGRMWSGMFLNLIWAVSLTISAWLLINKGALGLAWANFIAYTIHLITVGVFTLYLFSSNRAKIQAVRQLSPL
jgi:O-antigen/teichoic acid export membrane protein